MDSTGGRLRAAIDTGDLPAVRRLVRQVPSLIKAIIHPGPNRNYRPLTEAAVEGQLKILAFLIASGSEVNEDHNYPMFRAALYDRCVPALQLLVSHGADVNGVWDDYGPPVIASCEGRAPAALKWLLSHGAQVAGMARGATKEVRWNAVVHAMHCHKHCPELLALTLEHGGDVNSSGLKGDTALHVAARKGDVAGVNWLATASEAPARSPR
jgi:ankyrin repeat protein